RSGQTVILAIFATAFLTLMVALVVNVGDAVAVKVQLQGAVDAAAYSGAMMQARALNVLTALNAYLDGVYYTYIGAAVSFGAALVVSAACKCPAPVDAWRSLVRPAIKAACAESGLKAVAKRQGHEERASGWGA
ncbi:MAG: hypothetical protein IIA03_15945, partial [Proteobacteria bacterium]|nr:hypothetical protein [Pseudomonadota bacterium]